MIPEGSENTPPAPTTSPTRTEHDPPLPPPSVPVLRSPEESTSGGWSPILRVRRRLSTSYVSLLRSLASPLSGYVVGILLVGLVVAIATSVGPYFYYSTSSEEFSNECITSTIGGNDNTSGEFGTEEALMNAWSEDFQLNSTRLPPAYRLQSPELSSLQEGAGSQKGARRVLRRVPRAPHLEDCFEVGRRHREWDERGPKGEEPSWVHKGRPPWVVRRDMDNLAGTRFVQTLLWRHQFPSDCSNTKLLFAMWPPPDKYGLGTQLGVLTSALYTALKSNRTLVFLPGTFLKANHSGCAGVGRKADLACYFLQTTTPECELCAEELLRTSGERAEAMRHIASTFYSATQSMSRLDADALLRKQSPNQLEPAVWTHLLYNVTFPEVWGEPWLQNPPLISLNSTPFAFDQDYIKLRWWKAQAIRFFLRAPSPYLCHMVNKIRHEAYGTLAARKTIQETNHLLPSSEGCSREAVKDVWVPRPLLSMHVRQGDKEIDKMTMFSLDNYVEAARKLREGPGMANLTYVWLTTEMQPVVDSAASISDFSFLYSRNPRQKGKELMSELDRVAGLETQTGISMANLWISSQSDAYVGNLWSGWTALIDWYRLTAGQWWAPMTTLSMKYL